MTQVIDGKQLSADLLSKVAEKVAKFKKKTGITPGLAVVLVGEDPASQVYVNSKIKRTTEAGMASFEYRLPAYCTQSELNERVDALNKNPEVHGILVQLPLPEHLDEKQIIEAISPLKDVDGFHPVNVGAMTLGDEALIPCTPAGCMLMLASVCDDLAGKHALVIGRSNIVGKPMAALLLQAGCTVTITHSKTQNIEQICSQADILVAAVGRPELVKSTWVKPGAIVIDVGINAIERDGKRKLLGDVDYSSVSPVASAITPVPGGVGPMTIACLIQNTLTAAQRQLVEE